MSTTTQPKTFPERDEWLRAVLASDLPHAAARVAAAIGLHLHVKSGRCNPGHKVLADEARVSERSAYRWIELLERADWIEIERASGLANQYVLRTPATSMAGVTTATSMAGVDAATPATSGNRPLPKRGGTTANRLAVKKRKSEERKSEERKSEERKSEERKSEERKSEGKSQTRPPDFASPKNNSGEAKGRKQKKSAAADAEADFAEFGADYTDFMSVYPRKDFEDEGFKPYVAARKRGVDKEDLNAGAVRYAAQRIAEEPTDLARRNQYTKHPATWLKAGGWKNKPSPSGAGHVIDQQGNAVASLSEQNRSGTYAEMGARLKAERKERQQ
jgi:hypothetical protein